MIRQLTGQRLTTDERIEQERNRDPSEPPMPAWWNDDESGNTGIIAATQLGRSK